LTVRVTASTAPATHQPRDQRTGSDRNRDQSPADLSMASLPRSRLLNYPVLNPRI
jgi:hypothetical protein